jgi:hypothetical protein
VYEQVVVSAQEDSVGEVGAAAVAPGNDVMCLGPGGWPIAAGEQASAVSGGEADSLPGRVQPLFAADVDDSTGVVEGHGHDSGFAAVSFDGGDADGRGLPFEPASAGPAGQVALRDQHANGGAPGGQDLGVGFAAEADQLDEGVQGDLLGGAVVAHQLVGRRTGSGIDEPWPPATR